MSDFDRLTKLQQDAVNWHIEIGQKDIAKYNEANPHKQLPVKSLEALHEGFSSANNKGYINALTIVFSNHEKRSCYEKLAADVPVGEMLDPFMLYNLAIAKDTTSAARVPSTMSTTLVYTMASPFVPESSLHAVKQLAGDALKGLGLDLDRNKDGKYNAHDFESGLTNAAVNDQQLDKGAKR